MELTFQINGSQYIPSDKRVPSLEDTRTVTLSLAVYLASPSSGAATPGDVSPVINVWVAQRIRMQGGVCGR